MLWKVKTEKAGLELTAFELLNMLMAKVINEERPDQEALAQAFGEYLQNNRALADITLTQLISMAFEIGYFYRIFKTKNDVEILEVSIEGSDTQSESTPTD